MALSQVAPVALLLTVLVVLPLSYLLILLAGNGGGGDARRRRLPPSPRGLPLLGHLHLLGSLPHRALRSLARAHGPVMLLRLGRVPTVVVSSAAGAEEVMRARDRAFANRPRSAMADRLLYGSRDVAFAPYGEYWRQARRVCVVHLLSARRVQSFRRVREQEAAALVGRVRAKGDEDGAAVVVGLSELLTEYANAVVSRAAFGDESARGLFDGGDRGREQRKVFTDFQTLIGMEPLGELLPWLGWVDAARGLEGKIRRTFEALDALLDKVIDDHRRRRPKNGDDGIDGEHWDFVDVLLDVHKHDQEYGFQLETNEIKAIILDMFAAGTDTTSTVMEWAMAELVTHPRAMRKLQDEIRAAVGSTGSVDEGHFAELRYLKAVVKETLRLHAPVALLVPREPPADAEILGYHVPARTRVVINAWAIGRDPATWEDAEEFLPERFSSSAVDFRGQHFELVPFGAGRRGCPGLGLAEASIEMALASLMYHFDWESTGGTGSSAVDMTEMSGISVHIKSGLPLVAKPWTPATPTC
ncbi:hypothetical protein SETIT_5G009900v2 [Setaria italica]|uniref:Cytochrome P450 71A1 n=1 Tax=Setaria italica TaxID=4555 RepID=K3XQD2_SETIT|nr:cytochrome P450 71A1 [Setaria italica]RCV23486.1 hypothetical protein SETIT_5G009900v2 [Setaria italica]